MTVAAPVFLVGSERSGTTLFRLMLDHHPSIAFQKESEYIVGLMGDDGAWPAMPDYHRYLALHRGFGTSGLTVDPSLPFPALVGSFLEQKRAKSGGKPVLGATVHFGYAHTLRIWPDARFLHIVRDPRDVARSTVQMGWAGNCWAAALEWVESEREWDRLCALAPPERRHEVTYEALIRSPRETLAGVCAFLGVPFDEAMFDYAKTSTYALPDGKLAEQWRRKASERDVREVEAAAGEMLTSRGYALSGMPRLEVDATEAARLGRESEWEARRFRWKRYGPVLFVTYAIASRLGIRPLYRWARLRRNAIDQQFVK